MDRLLQRSRRVIMACALENGAIVASDTDSTNYPKNVKSYRYVWPRDAAYTCVAADILGLDHISEGFFEWCEKRAYGPCETGFFLENYHTNGLPNRQTGSPQLDQTGTVLWAIKEHGGGWDGLTTTLADGLLRVWDGDHFKIACADLWEERIAHPKKKQNHTYTLASCSMGLRCAYELTGDEKYGRVSEEMAACIETKHGKIPRTTGVRPDTVDASLIGLVWPFDVLEKEGVIANAIARIEREIMRNGCLMRYPKDIYDSQQRGYEPVNKGAGSWPLLNLWMCIAKAKMGKKRDAARYFDWVRENTDELIPEQVFDDKDRKSVKPLCWAHSLYAIAAKELGVS